MLVKCAGSTWLIDTIEKEAAKLIALGELLVDRLNQPSGDDVEIIMNSVTNAFDLFILPILSDINFVYKNSDNLWSLWNGADVFDGFRSILLMGMMFSMGTLCFTCQHLYRSIILGILKLWTGWFTCCSDTLPLILHGMWCRVLRLFPSNWFKLAGCVFNTGLNLLLCFGHFFRVWWLSMVVEIVVHFYFQPYF
eukprot:4842953-Amphidinium_carterae.1